MTKGYIRNVLAKIASFQVDLNATRSGTRFTNRGAAGAVVITLPTPNAGDLVRVGYTLQFLGVANQTIQFSVGAGKGVSFNNAACASLAASTAGEKIGALLEAVWDGASWHLTALRGTGTIA